jgi:hypothetical protein
LVKRDPPSLLDEAGPASAAGVGIPALPEKGLSAWLPGLWVLRNYRRAWLARDVVAGLVLSAVLVPAGMGYATASGLPAITGLYATIVPLIAYAIVGPSRIMVLGPDSALVAMIAAAVVERSAGDTARAVGLASLLAILTGLLCIAAGFARAGFLTDLLSKPVRVGYMNGLALTVLVTQLPKLLGFSVSAADILGSGARARSRRDRRRGEDRSRGDRRGVPRAHPRAPRARSQGARRAHRRRPRHLGGDRPRASASASASSGRCPAGSRSPRYPR